MTRALVLNSGLAWAAYQAGALRHLVVEKGRRFDLCAGSGLGAINAALVACDAAEALPSFWQHLSWRSLTSMNWRSPWREGPLKLEPLKAFITRHVSESKLRDGGAKLIFNCLDIASGSETIFTYPGSEIPLIEALIAAATLPGLMPPLLGEGVQPEQWVDGTLVNSFIIQTVLRHHAVAELWAVATAIPQPELVQSLKPYRHWRAISNRALQLNQSQDVRLGFIFARQFTAAAQAHQQMSRCLPEQLGEQLADPELKVQLKKQLDKRYQQSAFPLRDAQPTAIHFLTPSQDLAYPLWRFRPKDLAFAQALGYADAQAFTRE